MDGRAVKPEEGKFYVMFLAEENRFAGVGACNRLMGKYETTDKGALRIGPIASTMMACPGMEQEDAFTKAALGVFGSGYVWLVRDVAGRPRIITTANQDTPMARGLRPLLCCDVWEHAYYLKHQNRRADYAADWLRVADWARANDIFTGAAPFSAD